MLDDAVSRGETIYGVTTRFGGMADDVLPAADAARLQRRALWLHATACGEPIPDADVRATMLARLASHVRGVSAVSPALMHRLVDVLNHKFVPVVREFGSIGASGDLVPLSYIAGAITGQDTNHDVRLDGVTMSAHAALAQLGLPPLELAPKDALAMINGTSASGGIAVGCVYDARRLLALTFGVHALAIQALGASDEPFHPAIHAAKPHPGQRCAASIMATLLHGSRMCRTGSADGPLGITRELIQERYSVRCLPQFLGPTVDALSIAARQVEVELNSATDNPLVDVDLGAILQGGNFLGQYLAIAMDGVRLHLSLAGQHLDAQLALLMSPAFSHGLPASLAGNDADPLNMGLKGLQITANSLVPVLASMASPVVDRFPTHAEQFNQNINSQSWNAGRLTSRALRIWEQYLGVALVITVQAVDLRARLLADDCDASGMLSPGTRALYDAVRALVGRPPSCQRALVHDDDEQRLDRWLDALNADIAHGGRIHGAMHDACASLVGHHPM